VTEQLVPYLLGALVGGGLAMLLRLPPLVGFLGAGFALNAMGVPSLPAIDAIGDLGVTLLLFTIGLKLQLRTLARTEVWGAATIHMAGSILLLVPGVALFRLLGVPLLADADLETFALVAFALSFSSTVLAVKSLEAHSDTASLYGRIAIGVLIMQDVIAVLFLTASSGELPSPLALLLVLLVPAGPHLRRALDRVGHGEMQVLFGVVVGLVLGYALFEAVGVKGDLGALAVGMLLAPSAAAPGLARALFNVKELLLVGFFLSIGLTALPTLEGLLIATGLLLLLPFKSALYLIVFSRFRLRSRTSTLATFTLTNYSEFGLIVAALATSAGWLPVEWLVILAVTVAMSFVVAAPLGGAAESIYSRIRPFVSRLEHPIPRPDDRPIDIGVVDAVVLGVGRVGSAAYDRLSDVHGMSVIGIDNDSDRVADLTTAGYRIVEGDASDADFWDRLVGDRTVRLVVLTMTEHSGNLFALQQLRDRSFDGRIVAVSRYPDEDTSLRELGADEVFGLHDEAGHGVADDAVAMLGILDGPDS
jgi:glutathione-regulated potassium-efflux system ancillary protein KefC